MRLIAVVLTLAACNSGDRDHASKVPEPSLRSPAVTVTYYELVRDVKNGRAAQYEGKALTVPGQVRNVAEERGRIVVRVGGPETQSNEDVICRLPKRDRLNDEIDPATLARNDGMEVHGVFVGDEMSTRPVLDPCVVYK